MLRIFLALLLCVGLTYAGEPIKGTTTGTCEPFLGKRLDLVTTPPLHLFLLQLPQATKLHEPLQAWTLTCGDSGCDSAKDGSTATITLDSADNYRWLGSFEVTQKDGTKQAGKFTATPKKQKPSRTPFHGCL